MYSGPSFPATISIAFFASTFLLPFYKFFFVAGSVLMLLHRHGHFRALGLAEVFVLRKEECGT